MHYHSVLKLGDGRTQVFSNGSMDWYRKNIISPFINGEIIVIGDWQGSNHALVNMSNILEIQIFSTPEQIPKEKIWLFESLKFSEFKDLSNCTSSIIEDMIIKKSSSNAKALLKKAFAPTTKQVFIIMKYGDKYLDSAYDGVIEPLLKDRGFEPLRVDRINDSGKISDQILDGIATSELVLSDLSGERPNCYYETGFAHALGKELILMIRKEETIHFDLSNYRFIVWQTEFELRQLLSKRLDVIIPKINR